MKTKLSKRVAKRRRKVKLKARPGNLVEYVSSFVGTVEKATADRTPGLIRQLDGFVDDLLGIAAKRSGSIRRKGPVRFKMPEVKAEKYKSIDDIVREGGNFPPLKKGELIEIDGKHKMWRGQDGAVYHDSVVGDSVAQRAGAEREFFSAGATGRPGNKGMERAHSLGQGTGFESPFGIYLAPRVVNQTLQNNGIELFMRQLHKSLKGTGREIRVKTCAKAHDRSIRLKQMTYRLEVTTTEGKVVPLFEYGIDVGNTNLPNPAVTHGITHVYDSQAVTELLPGMEGAQDFKGLLVNALSRPE